MPKSLLEQFADFAATKPPNEKYNYNDLYECAAAQFFATTEINYKINYIEIYPLASVEEIALSHRGPKYAEYDDIETAAFWGNGTWGQAHKTALKLLELRKVYA
jgi:hypothetical protein